MEHVSLVIAFTLLATLLIIVCTRSKINFVLKFLLVPITIWYGMVLYFTPSNLLGWSKDTEPPNKTLVISAWVEEPSSKSKGGIYFWCIPTPNTDLGHGIKLDPREFTEYMASSEPRSFKIPYSK